MSDIGKRGVKPKPRAEPRQPLEPQAPKELTGARARAIYRNLASELAVEGYACQADWRTVALVARTEAHLEVIEAQLAALASLVVETKAGPKVHPLVSERRQVCSQLQQLYASLFLNPRARSSSRLAADSGRQIGAQQADGFDDFLEGGAGGGGSK